MIEILGFSLEEFREKKLWELGFFKDVVTYKAHFADGRRIIVELVSNVYEVDHNRVIKCNIRDIAERSRAENALMDPETRYRRFFEAARDGILILDA